MQDALQRSGLIRYKRRVNDLKQELTEDVIIQKLQQNLSQKMKQKITQRPVWTKDLTNLRTKLYR